MHRNLLIVVITSALSGSASASILSSKLVGSTGTNLSGAAPGTPFALDFRPQIGDRAFATREVRFIFESSSTTFTTLSIDLDSSDTVFSFDPWTANSYQIAYRLYDPQLTPNPGPGYPTTPIYTPITQPWIDELSDGVLSGTLWVNNPTNAPGNYLFSASVVVETPEPACGIFIPLACMLLTRRSRNA